MEIRDAACRGERKQKDVDLVLAAVEYSSKASSNSTHSDSLRIRTNVGRRPIASTLDVQYFSTTV